jgi:hypothetical protein
MEWGKRIAGLSLLPRISFKSDSPEDQPQGDGSLQGISPGEPAAPTDWVDYTKPFEADSMRN